MTSVREHLQVPRPRDATYASILQLVNDINAILMRISLALLIMQAHVTNATATHAITDPIDTPANVDALRDDLVANTIPSIESALNALGAKINVMLTNLESAGVLRSS